MPWFDPDLTAAEEDEFIYPGGFPTKHRVGRWPHPNTLRTDSKYIHEHGDPLSHTAFRRLLCWVMDGAGDPVTWPPWTKFAHWDLVVQAPGEIVADIPVNSFGWSSHIEIKTFDVLPIIATEGVEILCWLLHDSLGHKVTITKEFPLVGSKWQWDTDGLPIAGGYSSTTTTPGFPYAFSKAGDWAISDCFLFERDLPPVAGFARFDGIDSYIKNRSRTNDTTGAWRQEFDIRLHDTNFCHYLCKSFNTTRYCVVRGDRVQYINRPVFLTNPLLDNVWYHIDFRYQWDSPDGLYRVSVDGGADDTAANTNFNARWDQFGKRGAQAPSGEYDFKNFVLTNGPSSSPIVYLDQKFDVNACDDGPDGRDGDTFFMSLPSCP